MGKDRLIGYELGEYHWEDGVKSQEDATEQFGEDALYINLNDGRRWGYEATVMCQMALLGDLKFK